MISLDVFEDSYNYKQETKLLKLINEINESHDAYKEESNRVREEYYYIIKDLKKEITRCKALLSIIAKEKSKKLEQVNQEFKLKKAELDEGYKLDTSEAKIHKKLVIAKIDANAKKYIEEFDKQIQAGDPSALTKKIEFNNYYTEFKEKKEIEEEEILSNKLLELKIKYDSELDIITKERDEAVNNINEEYLSPSKKNEILASNLSEAEKKEEIKKLDLVYKKKVALKAELKEYKEKIKAAKKERAIKIKENKGNVLKAKEAYLELKKSNKEKIKELEAENKDYYNQLDKNGQAEYKGLNKYVKEDMRSLRKKRADKLETKIFKHINTAYIYAAPAFFGAIVFTVLPFLFMIIAAWFKLDLTNLANSTFVGAKNFINIFTRDTEFQKALINTVIYAFCTIVLLLVVTIGMAAWLAKNTRIHNLVQTMVFTPHIASLVAISILWIAMLHPTGIINQFLGLFGIKGPGWLVQENTSLLSVSFVTVWKDIGYYVLIIVAGLQGIPAYIYEAAKLDKSGRSNTFFKLTLPLLVPTLSFVFVTKFISSFKVFAPIEIMTNGGPMGSSMVLSYWIYKVGRIGYNYGQAMAGAIILTIMIAVCTFFNYRFFKKKVTY